ncbi:hypothetical protein [Candidatus Nitrosotenuis uzonensis]|uniref:Glyoxalase/bleomycin resistance protein/dioxygenase (Modular protein) n=1 Tax=Candidatus Nitrosotenuis uzonensis TaxID=1407055 RepID=A0A812EZH7_9ARCH|nr:hypothetical protein [Candidatus Nitrosotenuis uzonensis]CAE6486969.1 Glyoxalase/bleomycin resistance protein/dioxygenase (modular protein) [Candidatus Nitrosotenuis uzonensis]
MVKIIKKPTLIMKNISINELEKLLMEAEIAHKQYENEIGKKDVDWPVWFAKYIIKKTYKI